MKIQKVGRERPILYRGKFNVPSQVISRLAISENHLLLAQIANFNAKVDQLYLAIDNVLSSVIVAKEGTLTTRDHREKIARFFKYLRRRAKIRSIELDDFNKFYNLWSRSRYRLYFASSIEVYEMILFASHLFEFAITEIARLFKSDETMLADRIIELIQVYQSEIVLEESENILQYHQMKAEMDGEMYGDKLARKLLNPWNFINVSLLTDHKEIIENVDESDEIRDLLSSVLKSIDQLITRIQMSNFERIAIEIANAKIAKRRISQEVAIKEAIKDASQHPEVLKFRLTLNFNYDSSEPKKMLSIFSNVISSALEYLESPYRVHKSGWENYKLYLKRDQ